MEMIRGIIRPNNGHVQHYHGDGKGGAIHFTAPRPFVVDPQAPHVVDEPGRPLVLTMEIYDSLREKFGGPLVVEPVGGDGEEDERPSAADMRAAVAEIEDRGRRIAQLHDDLRALDERRVNEAAAASIVIDGLTADRGQLHARIAELEAAAAQKPPAKAKQS